MTDSHGNYDFVGLPAGTYHVREVQQPGWTQTYPSATQLSDTYSINLAAGQIAKKKDFGNFKLGTISGTQFNDANGNGRKDSGEVGQSGWTITLKGPNGFSTSTTTDASGNYSFTGLKVGTYTLSETVKSGWHQTLTPGKVKIDSASVSTKDNFGDTQKAANKYGGYFDFGNNYRNNGFH